MNQKGNALFLILIAVVLFAALSYAITKSDRGGGSVSDDVNMIAAATVIQYPTAISVAVSRMLLLGIGVDQIRFSEPDEDPSAKFNEAAKGQLFHPSGGGVSYQKVDLNMIIPGEKGEWLFTRFPDGDTPAIENIGTSETDMVAILPYLKQGVCAAINLKLSGSDDIPEINLMLSAMTDQNSTYSGSGISGQPSMCVETTEGIYAYYHVLLER